MAKRHKSYVLTETAAADFRAARKWSTTRWGKPKTLAYFKKLHAGAEFVAASQAAVAARDDLVGTTGLGAYPVGEHYLVYAPLDKNRIVIVALIRQTRDVPAILAASSFQIQRQVRAALQEQADKS